MLGTCKGEKRGSGLGLSVTNGCYSHHVGAGIELARLLIIASHLSNPSENLLN